MDEKFRRRTVLAISQVYPPDPASLGQHMSDASRALVARGHAVTVFTANRGYADSTLRYPSRESSGGVEVRRLPLSSFGKGSIFARLAGGLAFFAQILVRGALMRGVDTVLVSTSPPIAGLAGVVLAWIKRARLVYWVMDVNPDQAVALGMAARGGLVARGYDWMNRVVLRRADDIVVMDRFMEHRILGKLDVRDRVHVVEPWPHEDHISPQPRSTNEFRRAHGLLGKFVVMYSGNHALTSPLRTIIDAAIELQDDPRFVFIFVGGGAGKREVEAARATNILTLPYQPLETLSESLGAADLHVVTMRDDMVGIVHPCKVYGALAAARPVLFVGPAACHVTDLMESGSLGWHVMHGDVAATMAAIRSAASLSEHEWGAMSRNARSVIDARFSKGRLCQAFCDIVAGAETRSLPLTSIAPI